MDFYVWLAVFAILVLIGFALDREIYFYEGVHLGPRVQAWLYDRWSRKYDKGKRESQLHDDEMLAQPLLGALINVPEPFILDFATGTGRLSYALMSRPEFKGRILALDLSQGMLEQAASKLGLDTSETDTRSTLRHGFASQDNARPAPLSARVQLLRHQSLPLPFPDAAFDAVCALEVLELFPNMEAPLAELTRVLRPGGILLTSRGTEESGRKAKVRSRTELTALLERSGLENIRITIWWRLFDRVIAVKNGSSHPVGAKALTDVLKCSACQMTKFFAAPKMLRCGNCGKELITTREGIVLN
jgi:ubiquinone/menaquinone biosynthesis C-methylase UbiE